MEAPFTAGMNNNNPGNIKYDPSIPWQGQVGPSTNKDQGDPQVVFANQAAGMRALARNVTTKYNNGATTIQQLIAGPGGWTPGYTPGAQGVAAAAGLPLDQPIDMSNPAVLAQVMRGIVTQEHGPASSYYTDQMINDGISAAAGHPVPPADIPIPSGGVGTADTSGSPDLETLQALSNAVAPTGGADTPVPLARQQPFAIPSFNPFTTGDELALDPVTTADIGGIATAPTFDAGYDPATGQIRPFTTANAEAAMHPATVGDRTDQLAAALAALDGTGPATAVTGAASGYGGYIPGAGNTGTPSGATYTGQGIAGTAQLPSGVRPNIPSTEASSASSDASSWAQPYLSSVDPTVAAALDKIDQPQTYYGGYIPGDISGSPYAPLSGGGQTETAPYGGPYNEMDAEAGNSQSWADLVNSLQAPAAQPSIAATDPAATFTTQYSQQLNPAYTAWMNNQTPTSPFSNPGAQGLSPDDRDSATGIAGPVPGLTSPVFDTPAPQQFISVAKRVPVATISPSPAPVATVAPPMMTLVQQLQAAGLSPADAYTAAGASASRAAANPTNIPYAAGVGAGVAPQHSMGSSDNGFGGGAPGGLAGN